MTQELQTYYNGTSECARQNKVSRADLKIFLNETNFTSEKYVTKLKANHQKDKIAYVPLDPVSNYIYIYQT